MTVPRRALLDGVEQPLDATTLPVTSAAVARGDGAFETIGVWDGRPFRLDAHLDRLRASTEALAIGPPDADLIRAELATLLHGLDQDAALRVYLTADGNRLITLDAQPVRPPLHHLTVAPGYWIRPVGTHPGVGVKSMSYAPNMAATRRAVAAGAQDALLVSVPGSLILEGPTFGVLIIVNGVVHVPAVDLGIVDSVSRRSLVDLAAAQGLEVREGHWPLALLDDADELIVTSSVRQPTNLRRIDGWTFPIATPMGDRLAAALDRARRGHSGPG